MDLAPSTKQKDVLNEDAIYDCTEVLMMKHRFRFEITLEVVVFFANFGIDHYYTCADALLASAIRRKVDPRHLINAGLMNNLNKVGKN